MTVVNIILYEDPETETVFMRAPYNHQFVNAFKVLVPYEHRNGKTVEGRGWDPENKTWGFAFDYLEDVCDLAKDCYGAVRFEWA